MKKLAAIAAAAAILGFGSNAMAAQYELKIQAAQGSSSIYTQVQTNASITKIFL